MRQMLFIAALFVFVVLALNGEWHLLPSPAEMGFAAARPLAEEAERGRGAGGSR